MTTTVLRAIPAYHNWSAMIQRCKTNNIRNYADYAARGITVCDKWKTFKGFYEDMGDRPKGMSIDRIDNNGNYCKENCKWSTAIEQQNNTRRNIVITYNGKTQTLRQWSREININHSTLSYRLFKLKWSVEKSFKEPLGRAHK